MSSNHCAEEGLMWSPMIPTKMIQSGRKKSKSFYFSLSHYEGVKIWNDCIFIFPSHSRKLFLSKIIESFFLKFCSKSKIRETWIREISRNSVSRNFLPLKYCRLEIHQISHRFQIFKKKKKKKKLNKSYFSFHKMHNKTSRLLAKVSAAS